MKAITVIPGKPDSIHLAELPMPSGHDIPNGRSVLVLSGVAGGGRNIRSRPA